MKEYAVYKGEELLIIGTAKECAAYLNIKPESVQWLSTPSAKARLEKRKNPNKCKVCIKLNDDLE